MSRFLTLVSLLAVCHGFEKPTRLQAWLKDAVPLNSSVSAGSRIVGGQTTTIDKYPYTVSLQHEWAEYQYDTIHFCTGGIINKDWIVTAATCALLIEVQNVTVRVGSSHFHEGGTVHEIAEVVLHPEYDLYGDDYNLALLKLNDSLVFSNLVQPISRPRVNVTVPEDTYFTMASWGASYFMGDMTTELLELTMPTISKELCATVWGDRITDRMFCAYQEYEGMCVGDAGTPAVANGVLIGIGSFNYACAASGYPSVYTDVSALADWITETSGSSPIETVSLCSLLATAMVLIKIRLE